MCATEKVCWDHAVPYKANCVAPGKGDRMRRIALYFLEHELRRYFGTVEAVQVLGD